MHTFELFEAPAGGINKTVVILPGGFHPFHPGHLSLYQSAEQAFPGADIYYAATNDKSERPFDFADKQALAYLAGVPKGRFVQVKSPFMAKEIVDHYDPNTTAVVFARSEKDKDQPPHAGGNKKDGSPSYLQPWNKQPQPAAQHAYMAYLPTVPFKAGASGITSATEIRQRWPKSNDAQRDQIAADLYPNNPQGAKQILNKYLGESQLGEDAAGVGLVRNSKDPRYVMATMGDQNDVNSKTLGKMMKAYHLTGTKAPRTGQQQVKGNIAEAFADPSGLLAAAQLNRSFIITADLAEGGTKKFRVRAQSERAAREKFSRHHNQAKIVSVVEEGVAEGLGQEPGMFELYNTQTLKGLFHPFEADNIMDAFVIADDFLEAMKKSGRGLSVRPVRMQDVDEGMFGIDSKTKGAIQNLVSKLSDIPGMWDHKAQTFTPNGLEKLKVLLKNDPKHLKYALNLTSDDYEAEGVAEGILGSDPNRGQKVPDWAKRGIVGKIGRKLDSAWSDVQMTVPAGLVSTPAKLTVATAPTANNKPRAAQTVPRPAVTPTAHSNTKPASKKLADKQGVAEGSLNEFAPAGDGDEGNSPYAYGIAIIRIGEDLINDWKDDPAEGQISKDAAQIIQVGKTFLYRGMKAGIAALFDLDTFLEEHILEHLEEQGFNVQADIYSSIHSPYAKTIASANQMKAAIMAKAAQKDPNNDDLNEQGVAEGSESECPRCHSTDIKTYSDGEKECHQCHKTWDVKGVAEAKGKLTYTPEPTEYGVFPDSKNEFVKTFLSKDLALAHIKKFGGKLIVLDQYGRRMKKGVAEGREWDEGNTEPANNFAIYINGKKWKVFPAGNWYADSPQERNRLRQLQDWAAKKSASSGKKWTVHLTGEAPTLESAVIENAEKLNIGDPVIITGKGIEFEGKTGDIDSFGEGNRFVVVNLYNHGKHSFHASDVSYNDYADQEDDLDEDMYQYDKADPYNSEFAPRVGMGRMTLRGWKQSLIRRVTQLAQELETAGQDIDRAAIWDHVYKKMQNLNMDPIAQEIELAHQELENIRRRGGVRSRAFKQ